MSESPFSIEGVLLGIAVGDALGLPYENLSKQRGARLLGQPGKYRLWPGCGLVSDDTEHAWMTARALCLCENDVSNFANQLARELRWWVLLLPAGAGRATLISSFRLWFGASPLRSGVHSAGNGPAMRSPLLGVAIEDPLLLREFVTASTRITHTDQKAECGALAVAVAARLATRNMDVTVLEFREELRKLLEVDTPASAEMLSLVDQVAESVGKQESTAEFAEKMGLNRGVSGYIYHTVPVVLHAWLRNQEDYESAVLDLIRCGGDTDTTAAIAGGIIGARVGRAGIPEPWLVRLRDWPRTVTWTKKLAETLFEARDSHAAIQPSRVSLCGILLRNLAFLMLVLFHGFRRLLPPY